MNIISNHYYTHHADRHPTIGCIAALATALGVSWFTGSHVFTLAALAAGGFVYGVLIEIGQRIVRRGKAQNSNRESLLDIAVTSLWPVFLWEDVTKR